MVPLKQERFEPAPKPAEPKRRYTICPAAFERSRRRGSRRGLASRYALRSLPPIEEEEP